MPAAALPAIGMAVGGAGKGASAASGKKAQNAANNLASSELGLQKSMFGQGSSLLGNASNYYNALLHGGQAAVQATGPIASQIGQAAQGARNSIQATMPRGGEQNLALAQSYNDASNNIARLYAGMQPAAAQGLGGLGSTYFGAGSSLGFPASMSGLGAAQMGMQNAQGGAQGFGSLLYNSMNKLQNGKGQGGATFGSAPWVQGGSIYGPSAAPVGPPPIIPGITGPGGGPSQIPGAIFG